MELGVLRGQRGLMLAAYGALQQCDFRRSAAFGMAAAPVTGGDGVKWKKFL